jgi:hypothetical protein
MKSKLFNTVMTTEGSDEDHRSTDTLTWMQWFGADPLW